MTLILFTLFLMVVGILIWLFQKYIPVTREMRRVLTIALAVIFALLIADFFDVFDFMKVFHFDR